MEATLQGHVFTIKELNAYGVMCIDVCCVLHIMICSIQWRLLVYWIQVMM